MEGAHLGANELPRSAGSSQGLFLLLFPRTSRFTQLCDRPMLYRRVPIEKRHDRYIKICVEMWLTMWLRSVFKGVVFSSSDQVFQEYERTGYVWEQYDPITGEGKRRCVCYVNAI